MAWPEVKYFLNNNIYKMKSPCRQHKYCSCSADDGFERIKPGTRAQIYWDGTIIWYAPVIYKSSCNIRVQWFPFDTQVCDMIFLSWSYNGLKVDMEAERSADAAQNR